MAATLGTLTPFRYRGYIYDEETGFYYLRNRYYYPNRGRFINHDKYLNIAKRLNGKCGTNLFCYCLNAPLIYNDNEGCLPEKGIVNSTGVASETNVFYTLGIIKGFCCDGYGNEADARLTKKEGIDVPIDEQCWAYVDDDENIIKVK